ncbi:MAG: family 16 glycoside hydrolase [Planctomycetota bacterium]
MGRSLAAAVACVIAATGALSAAEEGWIELIDADLSQWERYGGAPVPDAWSVDADGVLTLDGAGGDLATKADFADFDFRFEWRISSKGNSGVMYRVAADGERPWHTGPEYQVLDDADYGETEPRHLSGSIYALCPRRAGGPKPAGEWNTGRIVLAAGKLEHWLNGELVAEADLESPAWADKVAASKFDAFKQFGALASGRLVLQDHGNVVSYRNLRVKRLDATTAAAASSRSKRVLFVTQSQGFRHSTVTREAHELSHAEQVLTRLGVESGAFRVDCTQDVETDFTPELLSNYDCVAFYTTGWLPIPLETLDWFLEVWLAEEGHAVLGVHSAADTYHDYEPFWDMLGGTFDGHPWSSTTNVVLRVNDGAHPASEPWGATGGTIALTDEIYQFRNWQPEKVRVLMSLDMERTELKRPRHIPVLWVKDYGSGRVMHMSLGHREDVWDHPTYQASLVGGMRWLLDEATGDATPNPEVSAREQKIAEAAASDSVGG